MRKEAGPFWEKEAGPFPVQEQVAVSASGGSCVEPAADAPEIPWELWRTRKGCVSELEGREGGRGSIQRGRDTMRGMEAGRPSAHAGPRNNYVTEM